MSRRKFLSLAVVALSALSLRTPAFGGDEPKAEPPAPATVAVEKGPFAVYFEAGGAFEPRETVEVSVKPLVYGGEMEVVEAWAGGPVEKGQMLVRLKTEKIDEQIEAAEADLKITKTVIARQTEDAKRQDEATAIALAKSEFDAKRTEEALRLFEQVDKPLRIKESETRLQGTKDNIGDQAEELAQLEKMYKADEVVEATEEIVLRRSRRNLERAKLWQSFQQQHHDQMISVDLPRELTGLTLDRRSKAIDWDRIQVTAPLSLDQSRLELARSKMNLDRQEQALAKLVKDREGLEVKAPAAGYAVPGAFSKGKWSGLDETAKALRPGQKVGANQPLFTIFSPNTLGVRTSVSEAGLFPMKSGLVGTATLIGDPDTTLPVTVSKVARFSTDGNYEVLLDLGKQDERLVPGQSCKLKIATSEKPDALTVPAGCVVKDGEKTLVHVVVDGKSSPKEVKVGATSGGRTEIREGVSAGERVLESPPKPK